MSGDKVFGLNRCVGLLATLKPNIFKSSLCLIILWWVCKFWDCLCLLLKSLSSVCFFMFILSGVKQALNHVLYENTFFKISTINWVQLEALYPWSMLGLSETLCTFQGLYIRIKTQNAVTESPRLFLSPSFPKAVTVQCFILKHFLSNWNFPSSQNLAAGKWRYLWLLKENHFPINVPVYFHASPRGVCENLKKMAKAFLLDL